MRTRYRAPVLAALLPLVLLSVGCDLVRAKAAFKDGNRLYKEENYRKAIDEYERAVQLKPDFAEAHFYLASSQQSLYRPGKEGEENRMRLDKAIEHFEKCARAEQGRHAQPPAAPPEHARRAHRDLLGAAAVELREGPRLRGAPGQGQPERRQEPLRDGEPLREVRPRGGGGADLREGQRAEPEGRQGLRGARRLLQQAAVGRQGRGLGGERARAPAARSSTPPSRPSSGARTSTPPTRAATTSWRCSTGTRPTATRCSATRRRTSSPTRASRRWTSRSRPSPTTGRRSSRRACCTA